jgi:hypothetical protein
VVLRRENAGFTDRRVTSLRERCLMPLVGYQAREAGQPGPLEYQFVAAFLRLLG